MKSVFLASLCAAVVLGTVRVPAGDPVTFTGTVTNVSDGSPLDGVRIQLVGTSRATTSAADGSFELTVDEAGVLGAEVQLQARRVGFVTETVRVGVSSRAVSVNIAMRPGPVGLDSAAMPVAQEAVADAVRGRAVSAARQMAAAPPSGFRRAGEPANREGYAHIVENGWRRAGSNPLSTFSIDVDRASYSNVRRFITSGQRPPIDAVRVEELINYFPYDYPEASGEHPFSVTTEIVPAPWKPEHLLARIGIQGRRIDLAEAPANNLVFLLDVSGSMNAPDKLPLLKRSFRLLVNELRPQDRVAVVVYAGAAGLVLPSTPGTDRETILDAIDRLQAGGSTAGGAGIRLAYKVAQEHFIRGGNNRVLLATDGDFNVGASSDAEMIRLIEEKRKDGTFLTVLGFGTGNLQDAKMEQIADHGNGNFAYIDNLLEAKKVLVTELGGTMVTIAKDVKLQIEFNPSQVQAYRLIGYENRLLAAEDFNDDTKDAGELGSGHSVTALYELVPSGVPMPELPTVDSLRYQAVPEVGGRASGSDELFYVKLRYKAPDGDTSQLIALSARRSNRPASVDLRFAAAVAGFGMLLRDSEYCDWTLGEVVRTARGALGADLQGYRAEFVRLVEQVQSAELLARR